MENLNQQAPENSSALPQGISSPPVVALVLLTAVIAGAGGYWLGAKTLPSTKKLTSLPSPAVTREPTPTIPTATLYPLLTPTINPLSQIPTPMYTPGEPTVSDWQPSPLQSMQDLPLIASAVIDWVLQHQPSPNPEISFTENDGIYARGLLGDLTQKGGEGWYAAKINGNWAVVYVGQASPRCSDIVQYHLPKDWLPCESSF